MEKHIIGIIGAGTMGQRMLSLMTSHPSFKCVGIYDQSADLTSEIGKSYPELRVSRTPEELISDSSIECVYIASPPASHIAYMHKCFDSGKAVFCEKPLCVSQAEGLSALKRVKLENLLVAVNFPFATTPSLQHILKSKEKIGNINAIDIEIRFKTWPRPWQTNATWLGLRKEGGFTREVLSHFLFAAMRILGSSFELREKQICYPPDNLHSETQLNALFMSGNVPITVNIGVGGNIDDDNKLTVTGQLGKFRMKNWYEGEQNLGAGWTEMDLGPNPREATMQSQLEHLHYLLLRDKSLLASVEEAFLVQENIEELLID